MTVVVVAVAIFVAIVVLPILIVGAHCIVGSHCNRNQHHYSRTIVTREPHQPRHVGGRHR